MPKVQTGAIIGLMSAITISIRPESECDHLRPFNAMRDLRAVVELVELCFYGGTDKGGRRSRSMHGMDRAGRFLRWSPPILQAMSFPHLGYVWEEDGRIVGNVSLVPFRRRGERVYLIANVAVHPDYRRRGIARALMTRALRHARRRKANSIWLHVRTENATAIRLYRDLGFVPRAERTTWEASATPALGGYRGAFRLVHNAKRWWGRQRHWLKIAYPPELAWYYRFPNWHALRPDLWGGLYRLVMGYHVQRWVAVQAGQPLGVLARVSWGERVDVLWAALAPKADPSALTALLIQARSHAPPRHILWLDYPTGEADSAIRAAGFNPQRTLLWMRAEGTSATSGATK
ncbi:MAG: GNAT family N-acetyltransferase [Anaerolineae bacterium]|nr:MAG: GNAT family N-acetyltransferase [Anaerolineae bacterium]